MRFRRALALLVLALAASPGCAERYFREATTAPPPARATLDAWPYREYWTGVVFNGDKVGFTHLTIDAEPGKAGTWHVRSEAALRFRMLAIDKRVNLVSEDWVDKDLALLRFHHRYDIDDNVLEISGDVADDMFHLETVTRGGRESRATPVAKTLHPSSVIALIPLLKGLAVGNRHDYLVFDGETQRISEVTQEVLGYERSELFEGPAFRVRTTLQGSHSDTWMNERGLPVLEMAMSGVLISELEDETRARRFLADAALNKKETLLDFSRVRVDKPLQADLDFLRLRLSGIDPGFAVPGDARQQCARETTAVLCEVHRSNLPRVNPAAGNDAYLGPSTTVTSRQPAIVRLAREITAYAPTPDHQIDAIVAWIRRNIRAEAVDVFSAADVLETRRAECQGHSFLYAALARATGIPTRIVNGLMYSEAHGGFLFHTWAESLVDAGWVAVDPTFGQVPADASHIKLVEGESLADLVPLTELVGQLRAEVLEFSAAPR